jgi:hypothetical protein
MARVEAVFALRDDMSSKLRSLATTAKGTETSLKNLRLEVNKLIRRLEVLDRKDVTVRFRTSGVALTNSQITGVQRRVNRLDGSTATVRIRTVKETVGGGGGTSVSPEMSPELNIPGTDISTRGATRTLKYFELRSRIIMGLLVSSIGALGPLTTAVQSLGLLVQATASGFLALGGAAAAAFAIGAKFFSGYADKTKEQMNESERALFDSVERIKKAFDQVVSEDEVKRFGYLSAAFVDMGTKILPMLDKPLEQFLSTFERLQKSFEESFFEPRNAALFKNAIAPLPKQFEALAGATGHFGRILLGLQVAAAPVVTRLFKDIEKYLGRKADYRTSAEGIRKSRDFFRDMRPILDRVSRSFGNIYDNLAFIGREGKGAVIPLLNAFDNLVDSIGEVLGSGARDFGESLAGLIDNFADIVDEVGPEVTKWLGRLAQAFSNVLDAGRGLPGWLKSTGTALVAFLVLRRIVPGMGAFVRLLGSMVKLLMTKGLASAIGRFGALGNIRLPGGGGTLRDRTARSGMTAVRIVGSVPLPVYMVTPGARGAPAPVGTPPGKGGAGKVGKAAGLGKAALRAIPGVGVVVGGLEAATILSGQGPLGKPATPALMAVPRMLRDQHGAGKGKGIVEGVLDDIPATKQSAAGLRTQVMTEIKKLPPEMQTAAAKGAAEFIAGLESKNALATGSAQVFLEGARAEIKTFAAEVAKIMADLETVRASSPVPGVRPPSQLGPVTPEARGGIITGTQFSMLGERGPEAVIPLTNRARRDQVMREAGLGGGAARGQRSSSPIVQIGSVTVNDGSDMDSFVARLESAVRRGLTNLPHGDAEAMLA